ncbi:hypothetical protein [Paenibacillus beijingensis]|uniref:Uncharacterized protein n=1 Tax=Paenibacillus beijingensis TaxID=1126833 RepID=A0A0D5NLL6_9BACL|nr:hypothetical protein [Paenibacillus beijingensis]AJY76136.1 hypothetical protein VN24_18200 [Paenibacillus beijingensis]
MAIEHGAPQIPPMLRVMIQFESTGWFDTTGEEKTQHILPKLNEVLTGWKDNGSKLIGTLDRDILTAGHAGSAGYHAVFLYDVPDLQTVTNMTHSFRATGLDRYFRLEAVLGRPFFLLEKTD